MLGASKTTLGKPFLHLGQDLPLPLLLPNASFNAPSGQPEFGGDLLEIQQRGGNARRMPLLVGTLRDCHQLRLGHHFATLLHRAGAEEGAGRGCEQQHWAGVERLLPVALLALGLTHWRIRLLGVDEYNQQMKCCTSVPPIPWDCLG